LPLPGTKPLHVFPSFLFLFFRGADPLLLVNTRATFFVRKTGEEPPLTAAPGAPAYAVEQSTRGQLQQLGDI
jgi:hypothetical protein